MRCAFDFARVPGPSAEEIKANGGEGALCYGTGAQQSTAYLAGLRNAGLHVPLIWEHNTDSILGGFEYGAAECRAWEATHPPGLVYLACDLNNGALAGRTGPLLDTCRGWASVTREPAFGLYGPDDAILAGQSSGIAKLSRWWGVVNWLNGGHANNDPRNIARWNEIGAHIVQLIGSPIGGTDQNLILRDDWWTTAGVVQAQGVDDDVRIFCTSPADPTHLQVWEFSGAGHRYICPDEWKMIKAAYGFAGLPEPKPFAGTAEMFRRSRDITKWPAVTAGAQSLKGTATNTMVVNLTS